jgi:hypothetical protein
MGSAYSKRGGVIRNAYKIMVGSREGKCLLV